MSIEVSLIISLLGAVIGSSTIAESVVELFKKFYNERKAKIVTDVSVGTIEATIPPPLVDIRASTKSEADIVTDAAIKALDATHTSVLSIRVERMRQARLAFNTALILMIVGVIVTFIGVGFLIFGGNIEAGIISVLSGTVSEIISAVVFRFNKEANNRLDEVRKELSRIEMAKIGLSLAKEISDMEKRDAAISDLTKTVQNFG